jgi:uncharacterized repeat protein (TIGR03806 family)
MKKMFRTAISVSILTLTVCFGIQSCKDKSMQNESDYQNNKDSQFKDKLSDYKFFTGNLNELHPEKRVINYDLNSTLFTDYSLKDRFIVLPEGTSMKYTAKGVLDFPLGTILIKNFAYTNEKHEKIMIETRLLQLNPKDKKWSVMAYIWNKEQTDAVKHITGERIPLTLLDDDGNKITTTYGVPNTNDCKRCHINNGILTPIGPKARNLNLTVANQRTNQLKQWASQGALTGLPDLSKVELLPNWKDEKHFSLDQRARAYLDINCAHCHTNGGDAYNTGLFLEYEQADKHHLGIMKEPVSAGGGAGGLNLDIIPGDAKNSIFAYRMNSNEPGTAMPELGRSLNHKEGVKLIQDWINAMKK